MQKLTLYSLKLFSKFKKFVEEKILYLDFKKVFSNTQSMYFLYYYYYFLKYDMYPNALNYIIFN